MDERRFTENFKHDDAIRKISVVVNGRVLTAPLTGVQRYTKELLARWRDVRVIRPQSNAQGFRGHIWEQMVLPHKLRKNILFCPSNTGPLVVSNSIVTIHDMSVFDCPEAFSPAFLQWYRFLLPRLAKRALKIITVSQFVKNRIIECTGINAQKIIVIPLAAATQFNPSAMNMTSNAIEVLRVPSTRYVLVVGSLEPRKNLKRLLEAWAMVQRDLPPDVWLVVAGGVGATRVFADASITSVPQNVFLAGSIDESLLPGLFAGALCLAYVSYYEGFGLPPLEAMACGTAVLAGNRSSLPEVTGNAALLVDPFKPSAIADAIRELVVNEGLRTELAARGLVHARTFSWDQTAQKTWDVLKNAVDCRQAGYSERGGYV